jgi:hypothetical protein
MVLVRILGGIDMVSAIVFFSMIYGLTPPMQLMLFCAGLLMLKGMFIFTGDVLSLVDIFSSVCLTIAIIVTLPTTLLWIPAFFLLAKGLVSFM